MSYTRVGVSAYRVAWHTPAGMEVSLPTARRVHRRAVRGQPAVRDLGSSPGWTPTRCSPWRVRSGSPRPHSSPRCVPMGTTFGSSHPIRRSRSRAIRHWGPRSRWLLLVVSALGRADLGRRRCAGRGRCGPGHSPRCGSCRRSSARRSPIAGGRRRRRPRAERSRHASAGPHGIGRPGTPLGSRSGRGRAPPSDAPRPRVRPGVCSTGSESLYLFTVRGEGDVMARMFDRWTTIGEDPATGSAAGPLGAYLATHGLAGMPGSVTVAQGEMVDRSSILHAQAEPEGDSWSIRVAEVCRSSVKDVPP